MNDRTIEAHHHRTQVGLMYALLAYLWWGVIALYFKLLAAVPPLLVLASAPHANSSSRC